MGQSEIGDKQFTITLDDHHDDISLVIEDKGVDAAGGIEIKQRIPKR